MQTILRLATVILCATSFAEKRWITPDFFVQHTSDPHILNSKWRGSDCRAQIAKAVCLVDPRNAAEPERLCLEGGAAYAKYFEAIYDAYPPVMQKMFCSLRKIYIEKEFFGTAYAGLEYNMQGQIIGASTGIRKSVLDENLDLHTWASWKEQLSFGGVADKYVITADLPTIYTSSRTSGNDFLYFVIAHELGHIFDFANGLNRYQSSECEAAQFANPEIECEMTADSWSQLSWKTDKTPLAENEFPHRKGLCFYGCLGKFLSRSDIASLYTGLHQSNFISTYATTEPWDDFADSLAYYLSRNHLRTRYAIDTVHGPYLRIMRKLQSNRFASKVQFIEDFLNRSDIKYP